ncbi:hypothetical protein HPB52_023405 [Rhipicephalus sanguineus]|uniref:Tick transposon n=1 Tax=Rhipicephalus sanguineus TaxID=34632 RepID=A0A9D4SPJ4_RHISA|nr:hypothetical protein HPB52_023405 [Rhipicephalus sanguineus]
MLTRRSSAEHVKARQTFQLTAPGMRAASASSPSPHYPYLVHSNSTNSTSRRLDVPAASVNLSSRPSPTSSVGLRVHRRLPSSSLLLALVACVPSSLLQLSGDFKFVESPKCPGVQKSTLPHCSGFKFTLVVVCICINTKWVLRTQRLAERYEVAPCRLTEKPQRDRRTKVREAVQEAESASWRTMAAGKPALSFYSKAKQAIEKEPLYENSKGSGLLCEARCGMLRTRLLRATYTPNLDTTCPLCTLEEESIEHIVLRCPALKPQVSATSSAAATPPEQRQKLLAMALGFRESQERPQWETVEATKRRLEHWWCANYLQDRTDRRRRPQ